MENKRKASAASGAGSAEYERYWKRRKAPVLEGYDLSQGETRETTTQYGLKFVDMLRKTQDKSGRLVAGYFEHLPAPETAGDYYQRVLMPISISKIELKLHQRAFRDLSELEGYFKRMVTNAKEYHPRGSQEYEDAERIRKALSNYMVKTNPAYKNSTTYTATATPIGQEPQPWTGDDQNYDMSGMMDYSSYQPDADTSQPQPMEVDEPAAPATEGEQQAEAEADSEPEAEQEAPTPGRSLRNRSAPTPVVAKKSRRSGRRSTGAAQDEEAPEEASSPAADEADEDAEGEPEENADGAKKGDGYAGLTFQEAQEKIVEETMKKQKEGEDWPYFIDFLNIPPRSLKEYHAIIRNPMSLNRLQKMVKGIHGRNGSKGVTDLKTWAAFEENASLLWENAFYFNEEGSQIYKLAEELKEFVLNELKQAKAAVPEPSQPKIKLKVGQVEPPSSTKKITIHVGGRGGSADSSALPTGQSAEGDAESKNGQTVRRPSASVASPSPAAPALMKREDSARQSPANAARPAPPANIAPAPNRAVNGTSGGTMTNGVHQSAVPQPGPPAPAPSPYDMVYRLPGLDEKDALIPVVRLRIHPAMLGSVPQWHFDLPAHPRLYTQNITINLPASHWKLQVIPRVSPNLMRDQRQWKMFVMANRATLPRAVPIPHLNQYPSITKDDQVYDAQLQPGVNVIEVQIAAAIEKKKRTPGGPEIEVERYQINVNLMKS